MLSAFLIECDHGISYFSYLNQFDVHIKLNQVKIPQLWSQFGHRYRQPVLHQNRRLQLQTHNHIF